MNDSLHISEEGISFIEGFEGLFLHAYYDAVHVITIGYGHTNLDGLAPKVTPGLTITKEQARNILRRSLAVRYEPSVKRIVKVKLTQHQFDALVSFCFNCGEANLKRLVRYLNKGDYNSVARLLPQYNKAGGKVLRGLTRRRAGEVALWRKEDPAPIIEEHQQEREAPLPPAAPADNGAVQVPDTSSEIDRPDELPDTVAKWGGAASSFAAAASAFADWHVAAVIVVGILAGAAMYLYWKHKTT